MHVSSISDKAVGVCVCAGGKISRLADTHLGDIPCVIACVEWLGTAQLCPVVVVVLIAGTQI